MQKKISYTVSFCYSLPINCEVIVKAENEKKAITKAEDIIELEGELADEPMWGDEEPDYKFNKKNPLNSIGIDIWEN